MKRHLTLWLWILGLTAVGILTTWYLRKYPVPVLQPQGTIGLKERNLLVFTVLISIVVVVPVFGLLAGFAWKYREGNTKAKYTPELDGSRTAETIWWAIPGIILVIISIVTWQSSYALDPFKPLVSSQQTLRVQAVALDWKWLFIYPDYQVASVNEVVVPVGAPINFSITSDTVMGSFWVPSLGGQMYAMPGMTTQLHLDTREIGTYRGSTANITGKGFADMKFTVNSRSTGDFDAWVTHAKATQQPLGSSEFTQLAQPSEKNKVQVYYPVANNLYDTILMKHMMPEHSQHTKTEGSHE